MPRGKSPAGEVYRSFDGVLHILAEAFARQVDYSVERLRQLSKDGEFPPALKGYYPLLKAIRAYAEHRDHLVSNSSRAAAVGRVQDRRAEEIELRLAEKRRELIPLGDATAAMSGLCAAITDGLEAVPSRVTRDLALRAKIEAEIDAVRDRVAKALGQQEDALRTGRDPDQAPEAGAA